MGQLSMQDLDQSTALSASHAAQRQNRMRQRRARGFPESRNHSPHLDNDEDEHGDFAGQMQIKGERITMSNLPFGEWIL